MVLIIVESPTKAKTISKFLSSKYKVTSSKGHIRDLPESQLGIDTENNFEPNYVISEKSTKTVAELKAAAKKADEVILATDEDREGEAIAWHLVEALNLNIKKTKRIVFHEITKKAILEALENPRTIDQKLVDAQQGRRILDRLVGFKLSPFLWSKIRYGLSAGRVQSVAVRLICEKEEEINKFKPEEYWSIEGDLESSKQEKISAKLVKQNDETLEKLAIKNEKMASKIIADLKTEKFIISEIKKKETTRNPLAPFTTSSLQQEAANKLGFSAKKTMMIAQKLYEGIKIDSDSVGLITYMRTDSVNLSSEAVKTIRDFITSNFSTKFLPETPNIYQTKNKNAQEAHEAIRPTHCDKKPEEIQVYLEDDEFKLYQLIWQRTIASEMSSMILDATSIDIKAGIYTFRSTGSTIKFLGFGAVYPTNTKENILPNLKENEILKVLEIKPEQHFTEAPARFSEATIIKALEDFGIGRPSTYAPIISTIQDRKYVIKNKDKKFEPTDTGILVNKVLTAHFPEIVDVQFTAKMEDNLDEIAEGKTKWREVIAEFYQPFIKNLEKKDKELTKKELTEETTDEKCEKCGASMIIKVGRFGKFLACSNYPECKNTKPIKKAGESETPAETTTEKCEKCGAQMIIKVGRFGKFLACSNYPECKSTKPFTTGIKCPKCGQGEVVEKKTKRNRNFYGCTKYPDCDLALWSKPTGDKCPKCGSPIVFAPKGATICSNKECK